ncbi:hypothetical protein OJAV_G00216260 [Oryzias javanicus]|uniref:Uncharacterized protein n=1 Tax=Oryzias javanicus TaxID=123683 RepID=A0A437C442_ORYJA|nr:hypothetical protein OJAV_G00216260 [Oryzias javanicus]
MLKPRQLSDFEEEVQPILEVQLGKTLEGHPGDGGGAGCTDDPAKGLSGAPKESTPRGPSASGTRAMLPSRMITYWSYVQKMLHPPPLR